MEIVGRNGSTLDEMWRRVIDSDKRHFVFITKRGEIECVKEGTQKQVCLEVNGSLMVGVYDCDIQRTDFIDDIMCGLAEHRAEQEK